MHRTVLTYSPSEPLLSIESKFNLRQLVLFKILKFVHMSEISKKVRLSTFFFFFGMTVYYSLEQFQLRIAHITLNASKMEKSFANKGKELHAFIQ